jgi:hypothetical protein
MRVQSNQLEARDTRCEANFHTYPIDISQFGNVSISAAVSESGSLENDDRIQLFYSINGGAYQHFATNGNRADDFTSMTASQTGLSGSLLQIKIIADNDAGDEYYRVDDLLVTGTPRNNFGITLNKTNVTCSTPGAIDLVVTPGQINYTAPTSPYSTTGCSVTLSGSSSYTLSAGQVGCVTGSFTGSVTINGGTLINGGTTNPSSINFNSGTSINNGTLTISNFSVLSGRVFMNYGTVTNSGTLTVGGDFYNYNNISTSNLCQ